VAAVRGKISVRCARESGYIRTLKDLHGVAGGLALLARLFVALAASRDRGIAVPPIIPDQLEALVRDVLGDGRDE
jgi:hypothetical protein